MGGKETPIDQLSRHHLERGAVQGVHDDAPNDVRALAHGHADVRAQGPTQKNFPLPSLPTSTSTLAKFLAFSTVAFRSPTFKSISIHHNAGMITWVLCVSQASLFASYAPPASRTSPR